MAVFIQVSKFLPAWGNLENPDIIINNKPFRRVNNMLVHSELVWYYKKGLISVKDLKNKNPAFPTLEYLKALAKLRNHEENI